MLRQVGLAVGVAVFVAVLGIPHGAGEYLSAFQRAWIVIALVSAAGALAAPLLLRRSNPEQGKREAPFGDSPLAARRGL